MQDTEFSRWIENSYSLYTCCPYCYFPAKKGNGTYRGASSVLSVISQVAEVFRGQHPEIRLMVNADGSGVAVNQIGEGKMRKNRTALKIIRRNLPEEPDVVLETNKFSVRINEALILNIINIYLKRNRINCIIGPSGAGKSTLIRSFNRINDETDGLQTRGNIRLNGMNIYDNKIDVTRLRSRTGRGPVQESSD